MWVKITPKRSTKAERHWKNILGFIKLVQKAGESADEEYAEVAGYSCIL